MTGSNESPVVIGAWVTIQDKTEITFIASPDEDSVEYTFRGDPNLQLILSDDMIAEFMNVLPESLENLRAAKAQKQQESASTHLHIVEDDSGIES